MFGNIGNLIAAFREEERDTVQPYFWSNTLLVRYVNEALSRYAQLTMSFRDSDGPLSQIEFSAGDIELPFDSRILTIVRAQVGERELEVRNTVPPSTSAGNPAALFVNLASRWMRIYPTPVDDGTLNLTVVRYPLAILTEESEIPDVPLESQHVLLYWVKSRAYQTSDSEVYSADKAKFFDDAFSQETQRIYEETLLRHKTSSKLTRFRY